MFLLQILALVTFAVVVVCALKNFKRTIIVWVPLSLLFNSQVCVLYKGTPVALTVAANLTLVAIFFIVKRREVLEKSFQENFDLKLFMAFSFFSVVFSSLMSVIPIANSFNKIVKSLLMDYGMIYIFYRCLNSYEDIRLYVKTIIIVCLLITVNGLFESFLHLNFAGDFIYYNSPHYESLMGRSFYVPYSISGVFSSRFGLTRCYSFFGLHIHFGIACSMIFFLLFNVYKNKWVIFNDDSFNRKLNYIAVALAVIGVVLSNSKTPMLGTLILLFAYYNVKEIVNVKTLSFGVVLVILVIYFIPDYLNNFLSLTDEELAEEGGGSTVALRQQQFQSIYKLFAQSPIWGNGINAAVYYSKHVIGFEDILGAESKWFKLLADQGIIGCISYILMFPVCYKFVKGIVPKRECFCLLLSVLLMETTTGAVNYLLWFPVFIVVKRYYQLQLSYE